MRFTDAREYLSRFYVRAKQSAKRGRSRSSASAATTTVIDISTSFTCRRSASIKTVNPPVDCPDKVISPKTRKRASRLDLKHSKEKLKQGESPQDIELTKVDSHCSTLVARNDNTSNLELRIPSKPVSPASSSPHLLGPSSSATTEAGQLATIEAEYAPRLSGDTLDDGVTSRKASSHTVFSEKSNETVHHDPSKRCTSPIETIDTVVHEDPNPFSDRHALKSILSHSRSILVPRGSSQETSHYTNDLIDCSLSVPHGSSRHHAGRSSESTGFEMVSRRSSNSSDDTSNRILAGNEVGRREFVRSRALLGFNASAEYFGLESLTPLQPSLSPVLGIKSSIQLP